MAGEQFAHFRFVFRSKAVEGLAVKDERFLCDSTGFDDIVWWWPELVEVHARVVEKQVRFVEGLLEFRIVGFAAGVEFALHDLNFGEPLLEHRGNFGGRFMQPEDDFDIGQICFQITKCAGGVADVADVDGLPAGSHQDSFLSGFGGL